jgi:hypothetical protein
MRKILALLAGFGRKHNDALRANQGRSAPTFSFWRALVS